MNRIELIDSLCWMAYELGISDKLGEIIDG